MRSAPQKISLRGPSEESASSLQDIDKRRWRVTTVVSVEDIEGREVIAISPSYQSASWETEKQQTHTQFNDETEKTYFE